MVRSHVIFLIYEVNSPFQELRYCIDLYSDVIFRYHILMNFCTCDESLNNIYSYHSVAVVSIFMHNIKVQFK